MKVFSLWNPAEELATLHNRLNGGYHRLPKKEEPEAYASWTPVADVLESESNYQLALELPGMDRKDIDVKLESDFLEVSGERKRPGNTDSTQGYLNERAYGKFARRFRLPKDIDTTKLAAELKDGLLQITLPKKAEAQPRSIEIKGN